MATSRPSRGAPRLPGAATSPVVFFWSSPGSSDARVRPLFIAALESAAAASGARVLDLSPIPERAPDTAARVARAVAAYDAMGFPDAISELDNAAEAAAQHGAWGVGHDALVDLFLYRALAKIELGDESGAWSDFVRAATLDPARILDPARFRPSAIKSFARALELVSAREQVMLTVRAPAGSRVHIDGRATGRHEVDELLPPGEHYVWVDRPGAPPFARTLTLAVGLTVNVPEEPARPPDDAELRRRAARLGGGTPLVVVLSRQGGVAMAELRSLERRGGFLRGAVRLGPSPEADARVLRRTAARALQELVAVGPGPNALITTHRPSPADRSRWYHNGWVWLAIGAAGALLATSPWLLDSAGEPPRREAALDPGPLEP